MHLLSNTNTHIHAHVYTHSETYRLRNQIDSMQTEIVMLVDHLYQIDMKMMHHQTWVSSDNGTIFFAMDRLQNF